MSSVEELLKFQALLANLNPNVDAAEIDRTKAEIAILKAIIADKAANDNPADVALVHAADIAIMTAGGAFSSYRLEFCEKYRNYNDYKNTFQKIGVRATENTEGIAPYYASL